MSAAHEPREEFVNQLELQLRADVRRRNLKDERTWMPQSKIAAAFAMALVVLVSMVLGGGIVAASYHASLNEQRDLLLATVQQRSVIAKQRLALAAQQLRDVRQRVEVGVEPRESVSDAEIKVRDAEAEVKTIELDIAEIQATGHEPMSTMSAPLVSGRDFVTERWRVQMSVSAGALDLEKRRLQAARGRFEVGVASPTEVEAAATRVIELESALQVWQRKIEIRQTFLKGGIPAAVADLRGLEVETDLRRTALARRIEAAKRHLQDLKARIQIGTANNLNVAEAELRVQELQLELTKADYDLLLIRQQLGK